MLIIVSNLLSFKLLLADRHPLMKRPDVCGAGFKDGITNGAHWYDLKGGMQDFNYVRTNAFEVTFELSCCKYAPGSDLPAEWEYNRKPILNYIASTHRGVRGKSFNSIVPLILFPIS